jgi:hypothetical protein
MRLSGGRTWWAHFEFTRINIEPIILRKKIEDLRTLGAFPRRQRLAAPSHKGIRRGQTYECGEQDDNRGWHAPGHGLRVTILMAVRILFR